MPLPTLAATAALIAAVSPATNAGDAADIAALIATDQRMQRAFVERDLDALRDIFTDDYVLVVSSGAERMKADILAEVAAPENHWDINESSGWVVRVHGDTAIVVATLHQKGVDHGQPFDSRVKFSDTYIRERGRWRNVHAHASRAVDVEY
ncbi:MAG: nuclear transport factor 2 family protein [Dokdonella sp.]|uniref:nuclear transport factor 2 family protein n=1 Tax=Dokdonella sp. TaxID=2291710 RepID=UPI003F7F98EA